MTTLTRGTRVTGQTEDGTEVVGTVVRDYGFAVAVKTDGGDIAVIDGPATEVK